MQRLYIDIGKEPFTPRAASSGDATPSIRAILGTQIDLVVAFFKNKTTEALPDGTTGGRFTMKKKGEPNGAALLLDLAWEASGTGAAKTYKFSGSLDSTELLDAIGAEPEIECEGSVQWTLPSASKPSKCEDFAITVVNSSSREEDSIPATTDARWAWLKEAAPEANGFTHDDEAKTLAVEAGGITEESDPIATAALATHAARTDNPHATTKTQIGLGNCDNTSDANKPVSTATQTALNAKAPLASPAFTGTPTAPTAAGGTSNTQIATTAFAASLAAQKLDPSNNLSDLTNAGNARINLGLGSVNNTADADKPVSSATQTALNAKEATQTAASQAEAEAGTEAAIRKWSPLRIKQAIAALAPSGGGGGSISTPNLVWVMSDGDDTTGDGSINAPYATGQKAFDTVKIGYDEVCLMFGAGSFGGVVCGGYGWRAGISIHGVGPRVSRIGAISSGAGVEINSDKTVSIGGVTITDGYPMTLRGVVSNGSVSTTGAAGAAGADGTPGDAETPGGNGGDGGNGGNGGAVIVLDSLVDGEVGSYGGVGGGGGAGGSDGGAGAGSSGAGGSNGADGDVQVQRSRVGTIHSTNTGAVACTIYNSKTAEVTDVGGNAAGIPFA